MTISAITAEELKGGLRDRSDLLAEASRIRLHRAISWLRRAEAERDDHDARYIFLWIAFNAAYAREFGYEQRERECLRAFFEDLVRLDDGRSLHALLFREFSGPIRTLIDNRHVFEPFWRAQRDHDSSNRWETQFAASKVAAMKALMDNETSTVLSIAFDRLYVLRNQLLHGGATWNSGLNRSQLRDGARLLGSLVPAMIALMLEHPELDLGPVQYPALPG